MLACAAGAALALLLIGVVACAVAAEAAAPADERAEFHALLGQAGQAFDRGEPAAARAFLDRARRRVAAEPWLWLAIGFIGQGLFSARFVVQWLASERRGESVVPVSFWYLSIAGSLTVLSYAIYRLDPVFMLAYGFNSFVYVRNLMLIFRKNRLKGADAG
ncbi:MAG: hypothetical protein FJ290_02430 [Planctomycetes bacterium]|nr:hypothetical protein [Planctomycetota bacterium]